MKFEEIMAFNEPYNQHNINSLIDKIKLNCIVPYIGAGMSVLFDNVYPSWSGFLNNTFGEYHSTNDKAKYDSLSYEEKASFLRSEMGEITFAEHLKKTYGEEHLDTESTNYIHKSVYVLPKIFKNGLLITTNYDKVIEKIYGLHRKVLMVSHPGHYEALNRSLRDGELLLYKIHGDIAEPVTSIILTREQYEVAYSKPNLIKALKQIYTSKVMLFLGCSMAKDRPLEFMRENLQAGMKNFAIVPCKVDDIKERRLQLEDKYFTQAIIYPEGEHECIKVFLDYIVNTLNLEPRQIAMEKYSDNKSENASIEFTEEWFVNQNKKEIRNLGDRYLPDLNVELKIKNIFDALGRNADFYKFFNEKTDKVLIALKDLKLKHLNENIIKIFDIIKEFEIDSNEPLNMKDILQEANIILRAIKEEISVNNKKIHGDTYEKNRAIKNVIYDLNKFHNLLYEYTTYLDSREVAAVNNPYILLSGEGGIGKSHIIADTIMKRDSEGKKSLLFLGQHFKENNNPLIDILKMLELDCTSEKFLEKLNQIAKEEKSRIIIFIDALNEGNGKKIWKGHLAGIVDKFKQFPWIGLVVSIRTEYVEVLFADNRILENEFIKINHQGFSTLEYVAIKKYFEFYNIQFTDIPFAEQEFRNPLFLRLLCEGFRNKMVDLSNISISDIYKNYLSSINLYISETCDYSRYTNIVEEVIKQMVLYKYNAGSGNNLLTLDSANEIILDIQRKYNIQKPLLDELLSHGIITQNTKYNNEEYIYVTYEKLDDYLYAKLLIAELDNIGIEQFRTKYKNLQAYGDILEALAIALSESTKIELFEIFKEQENASNVISSFCNSLKWRKPNTISQNTIKYINSVVLRSTFGFERLFDVLVLISTKMGHGLNADHTVDYILNYPMPDRDAKFIPIFDEFYYEEGSSINRLLDWCSAKKVKANALEGTIRLTAIMMAIFLISSNNTLRDRTTKALVNLLNGRIDILISVLEKYKNVDDPYITERLYAVAFGCIVSEQKSNKIEDLALYVYDIFFKNKSVCPNMLLRGYAKNIIGYAKYKVYNSKLLSVNVQPPYKSEMPEVPTDEEIKKYKFDYKATDFKNYYWSQNAILNSMKVEYDRDGSSGGYGDFGRYIFQSYFSNWNGLNYNDLKNIAIKKIFNMGYDVEKHGTYDSRIASARDGNSSVERIGKKYQWIALYELAAQVADNYKIQIHTGCHGEKEEIYCSGSFEPNLRNIDPTSQFVAANNNKDKEIHNQLFNFSSVNHHEWLRSFNDLPDSNDMVKLTYQNKDYILLNGRYSWTEEKKLGEKQYQNPQKDLRIQFNSYIVKKESYSATINKLKDKGFIGGSLPEPNENYNVYNKEYYWSDAYHFYKNSYYCGADWTNIDNHGQVDVKNVEVLLPASRYITERKGDSIKGENLSSWYKPCMDLFEAIGMRYGKENSVLYDSNGEIICFDSSELLNEDIGFFINKELFYKYLEERNYKIFWTIIGEKWVIGVGDTDREKYRQPRISGMFTFDKNINTLRDINCFKIDS